LAVAACDGGTDAAPDGGPGLGGDGCDDAVALDSVDLSGIWHLDLAFEYGSYPAPLRFDAAGESYSAVMIGRDADSVTVTSTDVIVREEWMAGEDARSRVLDACRVDSDGSLFGHYLSCTNDECVAATFHAYPIRPLDEPVADNVALLGSIAWADEHITANVRVNAGIAYVARFGDGLRIVDVGDPAAPVELGHSPVAGDDEIYNDVKIVEAAGKTYALMASNRRGAVTVDVTSPANPSEVTTFPLPDGGGDSVNVHTLFVDGTRAYLANTSIAGLDIYDVANPASPQPLGRYILPTVEQRGGYIHDLYVEGGRAYLNYWSDGLIVIDTFDNPAAPAFYGAFESYPRRTSHSNWVTVAGGRTVSVHGDEDFGAHVRIVDVEQGSGDFMAQIGSYATRPEVSVHNIMAIGEIGLITYYQDGLRVLDLSDPTAPAEVGHYQSWGGVAENNGRSFYEGAIGVDYDNATGRVYLADTHEGLLILALELP
jgi:hypothetical protein